MYIYMLFFCMSASDFDVRVCVYICKRIYPHTHTYILNSLFSYFFPFFCMSASDFDVELPVGCDDEHYLVW